MTAMYSVLPDGLCKGAGAPSTQFCEECPVKELCLAETCDYESLAGEPRVGIYGGKTATQRIQERSRP